MAELQAGRRAGLRAELSGTRAKIWPSRSEEALSLTLGFELAAEGWAHADYVGGQDALWLRLEFNHIDAPQRMITKCAAGYMLATISTSFEKRVEM